MNKTAVKSVGVIVSTYNNPEWLKKTLAGFACQTHKADEIIIADDGSGEETKSVVEHYSKLLTLKHIWQKDKGWRKCRILNKAILAAASEYLIFTDQDCIPRKDFIQAHIEYAKERTYLSGGYFKLPMKISRLITEQDIKDGCAFNYKWLKTKGLLWNFKCTKLCANKTLTEFFNTITPALETWNGMNSSTWRELLFKVNGFNNRMQYGGEDRELGERLVNMGVRHRQVRYRAITLHLSHVRPYKSADSFGFNNRIRIENKFKKIIETEDGIRECEEEK